MIAVWFSCGAASAVALKLTVETYGAENVRALNNPVKEEHADNMRIRDDISEWCGIEMEEVRNFKFAHASAVRTWGQRGAMSFRQGAPCTFHLKKEARQQWEVENQVD